MANIVESILQLLGVVIVDCSQIWGYKAKRVPGEFKLGIHFVYFRLYYLLHWRYTTLLQERFSQFDEVNKLTKTYVHEENEEDLLS